MTPANYYPQYYIGQFIFQNPSKLQRNQFSMLKPYSTFAACNAYIITIRALLDQNRGNDAVRFQEELISKWTNVKFLPYMETRKVTVIKETNIKIRVFSPS